MNNWHALHFNKIAKVIREKRNLYEALSVDIKTEACKIQVLDELTLEFAEYFAVQNPEFDATKFIGACGFEARER